VNGKYVQVLNGYLKMYECHITIEPVSGSRFDLFEECCKKYQFRPAELLMKKMRRETPERSNLDSFCTGHGKEYGDIFTRARSLVYDLRLKQFKVWRCKIENIVFDEKYDRLVTIENVSQ